jgi:hypothetical protein
VLAGAGPAAPVTSPREERGKEEIFRAVSPSLFAKSLC